MMLSFITLVFVSLIGCWSAEGIQYLYCSNSKSVKAVTLVLIQLSGQVI